MSRDPPSPSLRDPSGTSSTEPRRSFAPRPENEQVPPGVPDPQNAQRPKRTSTNSRTRLEFHRTAHSFADYGSVKGATKMPVPSKHGGMKIKGLAPPAFLNTLDSNPGYPPSARQANTAHAPCGSPSPKRQRAYDPRPRGPDEEIADVEQDAASRADQRGSQTSLAHSLSPGVSEYQTVEESAARTGRSNRRSRASQGNQPPAAAYHTSQGEPRKGRESIESFDELAPAPKPAGLHHRTARLVSMVRVKPGVVSDPADGFIIGKPTRSGQHTQSQNKSKKRSSHEITNDHDELVGDTQGGSARPPSEDSPNTVSPSLSRRGDMKPTQWANGPGTTHAPLDIALQAAVCLPNLRYVADAGPPSCFLRPTHGPELRAFTEDGNLAESLGWLKISGKARTLTYHPESHLIKINQATDQTSPTSIGGLMLLKLRSIADALCVVDWVRGNLKPVQLVPERDRQKLVQTWDKKNQEISQAGSQASARRASVGSPTRLRREIVEPSISNPTLPDNLSATFRTPLGRQMQISAQQQTPLPTGSTIEPVASGSRPPRTRQSARQAQVAETPRTPVLHRWSEENPNWAADWKMPLVLERTTVDKDDIPRLDEGQFLNDNLIGYGLRYLFTKLGTKDKGLEKRVYLHNSFFYEKLKAGGSAINYDGVKSWTAKVDLLSYDYIVVPVNEHYHWWVAIICNPGRLDPDWRRLAGDTQGPRGDGASSDVEMTDVDKIRPSNSPRTPTADEPLLVTSDIVDLVSDDKDVSIDLTSGSRARQTKMPKLSGKTYNPEDPRIITLDSLGSNHPQAITLLKKYLVAEFKHKRNKVIADFPQSLGMKAKNIPEQDNLCDCGVYLLGYIQEFVKRPDQFVRALLDKETPDWDFDPSDLRGRWRDTIKCEQALYQRKQLGAKERRREVSAAKLTPKGSVQPSRCPSRETGEATNGNNTAERAVSEQSVFKKTSPSARGSAPPATSTEQHQPAKPANPGKPLSRQDSPAEDVVVLPPREAEPILPSIEGPEVEELPAPARQTWGEPKFIRQLSSSSGDEEDTVSEVDPRSFYGTSKPKQHGYGKSRTVLSSPPAGGARKRTARTRPAHTGSHFIVDGSPELDPVVERAEVVRHSDPIDLT